jgi:hypothetical protein
VIDFHETPHAAGDLPILAILNAIDNITWRQPELVRLDGMSM